MTTLARRVLILGAAYMLVLGLIAAFSGPAKAGGCRPWHSWRPGNEDTCGDHLAWWTVQRGDTMFSIAKYIYGYGSCWRDIQEFNPAAVPTRLRVGQRLRLIDYCDDLPSYIYPNPRDRRMLQRIEDQIFAAHGGHEI